MVIYNTTYSVEDSVVEKWLAWMTTSFIPQHFDTGLFVKHVLCKVLVADEQGGESFSLQLYVPNLLMVQTFIDNHEAKFDALVRKEFRDSVLAFKTVLEVRDASDSK